MYLKATTPPEPELGWLGWAGLGWLGWAGLGWAADWFWPCSGWCRLFSHCVFSVPGSGHSPHLALLVGGQMQLRAF